MDLETVLFVLVLFCRDEHKLKDVYLQRIWHDIDLEIEQTPNSVLWNSMVYPLVNMTIYGVIWYQGEMDYYYSHCLCFIL